MTRMRTWVGLTLVSTLVLALGAGLAFPQNKPPAKGAKGKVDEKEVDAAIERGAEYLKGRASYSDSNPESELVLFTLIHAGVFLNNPAVDKGITYVTEMKLADVKFKEKTYSIALAAMSLEAANRTRWQNRIAEYAHFLICNQCENGQWSYGEVPPLPVSSGGPGDKGGQISSGGGTPGAGRPGQKTQVQKQIKIECPKRIGPKSGDHSNTQYALLGLRACCEAGCVIQEKTWKDAKRVIEAAQKSDGGWAYAWDYPPPGATLIDKSASYGSMTCSGLCDLVICNWYLGDRDFKNNKKTVKAAKWIGDNFTVTEHAAYAKNPQPPVGGGGEVFHYYYLYALERSGMLFGVDGFGAHDWYQEGAEYLLKQQKPDGSWDGGGKNVVQDTCFAILFLRRATKPIVPQIHSK
ncbi:MAG: hypothetical protein HYZ53_16240 [Planctomycetes bacterium]|nr:hypothetical protein [Planctomycetota bacterium]